MSSSSYFGQTSNAAPAGEPRFFNMDSGVPTVEPAPGLHFRPVAGNRLMLNLVYIEPRTVAPTHSHDEEQIIYVLEGRVRVTASDETRLLGPGMGVVIPPFVAHRAETLDDSCLELDVFSPPRQALVDLLARAAETLGAESPG